MSTIALPADVASPATEPKPRYFARLVKAREKDAMRRIHSYLVALSDRSLKDLGYTPEDIAILRDGRVPMPH